MKLNPSISKIYEMKLYDGESDGLIVVNLGEGVKCYKLSKDFFDQYKDDNDIKKLKSVYVLYGKGKFYVGQAGIRKDDTAITSRIKEHLKDPDKDFVEEIVFFCNQNNKWDGGALDYLEASLIMHFKDNGFPLYKEQNNETIDPYLDEDVKFKYDKYLREIITMLDVLGYDAIRKLISDEDSSKHGEKSCSFNSIVTVSKNMPSAIFNKLITKRRDKVDICKELLTNWGISLGDTAFNFASYSLAKGHYWMEPLKEVVEQEWNFVLFNSETRKIVVFSIPQNTFNLENGNKLIIRKDKPRYVKLEIVDGTFIDKQSKIDFTPYISARIDFSIV